MVARRAIVLANLGTPDSPTVRDVRRFLRAFLSDRRVVPLPRWFWLPLLHLVILPLRAKKVAALYAKIWWPDGSPLRVITERQTRKLAALVAQKSAKNTEETVVRHAMVYGEPSLEHVIGELQQQGITAAVVLPLYPQYCSATTGSVEDQLAALAKQNRTSLALRLVKDYHRHAGYLAALTASVNAFWQQHGRPDFLLFSFHGIPQALDDRGDPYFSQCHTSAKRVAGQLQLANSGWTVAFQSRFGKAEWVKPYTDTIIRELAEKGVKTLDVIAPSFASDCLETLEEIAVQYAELFRAHGGQTLRLVPCLNDRDDHIAMMLAIANTVMPTANDITRAP